MNNNIMKIYLVRHGQKERTGFEGTSISTEGEEQAKHFAKYAKELGITKLYTSPYVRTRETSKIIGEVVGLQVHESESMKEVGVFEYLELAIHSLIATRPPEYKEAFLSKLKRLAKDANGDILIVTHSGFIRFMKALMVEGRWEKIKVLFSLYNNLGLTRLEFNGDLKITEYNQAYFLPKELRSSLPY